MANAQAEIRDQVEQRRFEAVFAEGTAYVDYNLIEGGIVVAHTETPAALRGRGAASALYNHITNLARERGWRLVPVCPVFAAWLQRHPEAHDLVDPGFRRSLGLPPAP